MSSSSKTPKGKRKASEKPEPPGAPKKGKKASTKGGEEKKSKAKKQLQLEAKSYMAICNVTVTKTIGLEGIFSATLEERMCVTSDLGPYYHQACNQARDRMCEKLRNIYMANVSEATWSKLKTSTEKLVCILTAVQVGLVKNIKTLALNVWVQQFKDGQPVANPKVSLDNSPEDDDPKSKINPEFDAEGNLVTNSDEAKASSSSS